MKTFAVINQKGGIGKTTLATNLCYELAKQKNRTLLIDMDHQANASSMFKPELANNLLEDILCKKNAKLSDCIYQAEINKQQINNLYIAPTSNNLANKLDELSSKMYRETILKKKLEQVKNQFDYCVIDCMTTASLFSTNAIYASENLIVPFTYGRYSLEGLIGLLDRINEVIISRKIKYFFVKNFYDKRTTRTNKFIEDQLGVFKDYICKSIINKSELINQANISRQPVDMFSPKSNASLEFKKLTKEIVKNAKT